MNRFRSRWSGMALWVAGLVALGGSAAQGASPWRGIKTPHFVVLAMTEEFDADRVNEDDLRRTGERFERIYSIFVDEWKLLPPAGPPAPAGTTADPRVVVFVYDWTKAGPYQDDERERLRRREERARQRAEREAAGEDPEEAGDDDTENFALAFHTDGKIHLRIEHLRTESSSPEFVSPSEQVEVITHELFHAVQKAYDPLPRYRWMREATAQWAVWLSTLADEAGGVRGREQLFLGWSEYPIGYFEDRAKNPRPGHSVGHPYGTSILFRYLGEHHGGVDLLKKYMEAWQASRDWEGPPVGPTPRYHPLNLVAQVVGTSGPDDPQFRELYDRFAVALALGPDAPGSLLADAARVRRGADRVNSGWDAHYADVARGPDDVIYPMPAVESPAVIPDGSALRAARNGRIMMLIGDTEIGTGGVRCVSIARPSGLPPNSMLRVEVVAAEGELSVQGLIRRHPSQPVEVVPGRYVAERRAYLLEVPKFETAVDLDQKAKYRGAAESPLANPHMPGLPEVMLVITRYTLGPEPDESEAAVPEVTAGEGGSLVTILLGPRAEGPNPPREQPRQYPVFVYTATPPTVARFTLAQRNQPVYDVRWTSQINASGVLERRVRHAAVGDDLPLAAVTDATDLETVARARSSAWLDPGHGDAAVEVWFSLPIPEAAPPTLTLNGQAIPLTPYAEEDRWRGTIPTSLFGTGEQQFRIRADSTPRGTHLKLPLDEDPLTLASVVTHVDLLDETAPRNADWSGYERTTAGMLLALGQKPPKRELTYRGLVRDGDRLWKPGDTAEGDSRKVTESSALVVIELDTGTVGGHVRFARQREPGSKALDRYEANLFSHVAYNYQLPATARGTILTHADARFELHDEEGPSIWAENLGLVLYRGDDLKIPGYPEYKGHFLVLFNTAKPDQAAIDGVLKADLTTLPPGVRAVLLPETK